MNFYIDFEATQPENEIIAVGAVAENGNTFYSLVKPQLSSISQYISQMTHISAEDLEKAKNIDEVFFEFDQWVVKQEPDIMKCRFISFGNDTQFIKASLPAIKTEQAFLIAAVLMAKLEDCYENTRKFFHGPIRLIHAFNFVQSVETTQNHNPLDDALMLQKVYEYTQKNEPLAVHPLNPNAAKIEVKMPSGVFWCKADGKNAKIHNFDSCDDAINWLISDVFRSTEPEKVHRDRVMRNIMKAIRTKEKYCNYRWHRKKEEDKV